jgi:isopenicillin-N epimerase
MSALPTPAPSDWLLDPAVTYLNHGAYGSAPRPILEAAMGFRLRFERAPMQFVLRELEGLLDETRAVVGDFLGADGQDLAFVVNATTGVNAVLASLALDPGDEILVTNHGYSACRNAAQFHAQRLRANLVVAQVPFPLSGPEEIFDAVMAAVTPRTRLALLDHVTSPTALVFPVDRLITALHDRGIETLIDAAHAPGMLPIDLRALRPTYYAVNFHKWCCVPKSVGVLYVQRDRQPHIRPTVISHGANPARPERSAFLQEFDWTGTQDPSNVLAIPFALRYLGQLLPGGLPALQARNHALVVEARRLLAAALNVPLPCPDQLLGSMATLPLPDAAPDPAAPVLYDRLVSQHRIEIPIFPWPAAPRRAFRVAAQIYNSLPQYQRLADALTEELARPTR